MTGAGFIAVSNGDEEHGHHGRWSGVARVRGSAWARMPLLTIGMLGLQIVWSVEMGYASPYLLSLGLSKSLMSVVFVAGPLSGLIVQPLIGVLADRSKSHFGRRRPYMIAGSLICAGGLLILGFTREFASLFVDLQTHASRVLVITFAVLAIYLIDFSINAVQAADRALLVDVLPTSEQELGNAWAGRMFGIGSVLGFLIGYIDLVAIFPFFGRSQLEVLVVLASSLLLMAHCLTAFSVQERVLLKTEDSQIGSTSAFRDIWINVRTLPKTIKHICLIQFFSWMGWFPILFFSTVWIGEIYKRQEITAGRSVNDVTLEADATRAGNGAMFWSSVLSLITSIVLPLLVTTSKARQNAKPHENATRSLLMRLLAKCKFHLAFLWALSHLIFAISMMLTLAAQTVWSASMLITVTGFCWAVTQWAPFSLLGQVIHASSSTADYELANRAPSPVSDRSPRASAQFEQAALMRNLSNDDFPHDQDEDDFEKVEHVDSLGNIATQPEDEPEASSSEIVDEDASGGISNKAGIILGIHNVFIVIPQFLVTGLSSILFALFEPPIPEILASPSDLPFGNSTALPSRPSISLLHLFIRAEVPSVSVVGFDSIGFIFRIGGISASIACILCWRLARELR